MSLSDLAVFSEYVYSALTEVIAQQIDLFNAASRGCIILKTKAHQGDFSDEVLWAKISGLVRRRDAYGSGAVVAKDLKHLIDTMVKLASGTPPINIDPGMLQWIQRSPEEAGAVIGQQLSGDMLGEMLNTGIMAVYAALSQVTAIVYDATGATPDTMTPDKLVTGTSKFGDRYSELAAWIIHSTPLFNMWGTALTNSQNLFTYGTVAIREDPLGKIFVVSDSPALKSSASPAVYHTIGLVPGAIVVDQNGDFLANEETKNGYENILKTYQAQWSYNLGLKGFAWVKDSPVTSPPNDAALAAAENWDQYVTSVKDIAGVIVETN
jgi:hypothetical protein